MTVCVRSDLRAPRQLCDVDTNTTDCAISLLVVSFAINAVLTSISVQEMIVSRCLPPLSLIVTHVSSWRYHTTASLGVSKVGMGTWIFLFLRNDGTNEASDCPRSIGSQL